MKLLQLLNIVRRIPIRALMDTPDDFRDMKQVRPWAMAVVDTLQVLAEYSVTELDDQALAFVEQVLSNAEVWDALDALTAKIELTATKNGIEKCAFNPMWILFAIQAAQVLLKMLRERRQLRTAA